MDYPDRNQSSIYIGKKIWDGKFYWLGVKGAGQRLGGGVSERVEWPFGADLAAPSVKHKLRGNTKKE